MRRHQIISEFVKFFTAHGYKDFTLSGDSEVQSISVHSKKLHRMIEIRFTKSNRNVGQITVIDRVIWKVKKFKNAEEVRSLFDWVLSL